ncbi:MAG: stage IV sporulation protein A [Eubacteriaceae bacterium]|nr:stage IV sporulation protein A [Eubacteriaceae bacterium]
MADIYFNIAQRTGGEIYAGIVGPVRTGKSTFIKRFMELFVVPAMEDGYAKNRVVDQLPQSGNGRTITTTEPKFIPEEGAEISIGNVDISIRMVDCVGYIVPGVMGHEEEGRTRMVKTPWSEEPMPFQEAAELGTTKVITEHSTVGFLVTTDGSFGEIPRENYVSAEEKTVDKLKSLQRPFVILLNSMNPEAQYAINMADNLSIKYGVPVLPVDCLKMEAADFENIFEALLTQFPVSELYIDLPDYLEALSVEHSIKASILETARMWMDNLGNMADVDLLLADTLNDNIGSVDVVRKEMSTGRVYVNIRLKDGLYYSIVSEILGIPVSNDKEMFGVLRECSDARNKINQMSCAFSDLKRCGYGIVSPDLREMTLGKPEVFKQGSKFGVRIVASAPCLHMIRTELTTEIAPIVGSEQQSNDLVQFLLSKYTDNSGTAIDEELWETNLFGKSIRDLVIEQMSGKLTTIPDHLQDKIRRSLQRISNEGKDYYICIII